MTSLPAWLLPALASLVGALLLAIFGYLVRLSTEVSAIQAAREVTCREHGNMLARIPEIEKQLERLVYRQQLSDDIVTKQAAAIIHSPIHVNRDELVDKLVEGTLTGPEAEELKWRLEQMLHEEPDNNKRLAAALLLVRVHAYLPRGQAELENNGRLEEGECRT
jgi:hypothetical protein